MTIKQDSVVSFHYTLKDDEGAVLDTSDGGAPLAYLHGHNNIVPGLEKELEGKSVGDKLNVKVSPAEGYGEFDPALVQRIPRRQLRGVNDIYVGLTLHAHTPTGRRHVTVTQVLGDTVTVDANNPLAGKTLHFDVAITEVRDATAEELQHGHVHGPHGHHH